MKSFQIHRLAPVLFLALTALFTACDSLTGPDPDEPVATLEANTDPRSIRIQGEPLVWRYPDPPDVITPDEIPDQTPLPVKTSHEARGFDDRQVEFSAALVAERVDSITVRLAARAADSNLYYILRQIEGEAPVLVRYFNGASLPTVTETLAKHDVDLWVAYWIEDDGGAAVTARIRFAMPAYVFP